MRDSIDCYFCGDGEAQTYYNGERICENCHDEALEDDAFDELNDPPESQIRGEQFGDTLAMYRNEY